MKPRLLNGCAKSGFIVEAFEALGWDAWTCDILPAEHNGKHIQDDVLKHLDDGWDMAIFHPECTYLSNSGVRWFHEATLNKINRWSNMLAACGFFNQLLSASIPKIVVENPIQHGYARNRIVKYSQIIQPHYFGDKESKATCLWLKGLPMLVRTHWIDKSEIKQSVWREAPSPERQANRSRTFQGIANAMAEQWSNHKGVEG